MPFAVARSTLVLTLGIAAACFVPRLATAGPALDCGVVYACDQDELPYNSHIFYLWELVDDVHLDAPMTLCAVEFRVRAGNYAVVVYAGSEGDGAPGALLVGPVPMSSDRFAPMQAYRIDLPPTEVPRDLWVGVRNTDVTFNLEIDHRETVTAGTSHDLWYFKTGSGAWVPEDNLGDEANIYLKAYGMPTTPTLPATWGAVKATYR